MDWIATMQTVRDSQLIMSPLKCEIQFDYDIHAFLNAGTNKSMEIERGRQITRKCFWDANCGKI